MKGHYHPSARLRLHTVQLHLNYDGSLAVSTNAEVTTADGQSLGQRHGYTHRVAPTHPHYWALCAAIRPAFEAHHEHLGLDAPVDRDYPLHLHPRGHPAYDRPEGAEGAEGAGGAGGTEMPDNPAGVVAAHVQSARNTEYAGIRAAQGKDA